MKNKVEIIYSILSETAGDNEKLRFKEFLRDEANRELFQQLKKIWDESPEVRNYKKYDSKRAIHILTEKINQTKKLKRRYLAISVSGIAAGILIVLGLWGAMGFPGYTTSQSIVQFQTETGNRSVVVLPDSSKVWLNSKTKLAYNSGFGKNNRNVKLSGEGFFEVRHGDTPFIVDVSDYKVKVFGTKFNVSSYPDDQHISTCLESGKISIVREGKKELFMKPGQLLIYEKGKAIFKSGKVDTEKYSAWKANKMYMDNESLNSLAKKLERKYSVSISFSPDRIGSEIHYSGIFSNENMEEILDAIAVASNLKYTKEENKYTIRYR